MRRQLLSWALIGLLSAGNTALANPGEDGDQIFSAGTSVVNAYSALTADATAGDTTITVSSVAELALIPAVACPTNGCLGPLAAGDLLMIYQPQGVAAFDSTDTVAYGAVSDLGSAGQYEFVYVQAVDGGTGVITIATTADGSACAGLRNSYDVSAVAGVAPPMVIRVPQYQNLTVDAAATLAAAPWNWSVGSTGLGGVLVIDVRGTPPNPTGNFVLNGTLTAAGLGFRGGIDADGSTVASSAFRTATSSNGAQKGESVAGGLAFYDANGGRFGRGAPANGGGGGDGINSSGGGGANGGNSTLWTNGRGVPDRTNFGAIWGLEVAAAPTSVNTPAGLSDDGGGRGGYTWSSLNADATTVGPNNAAWGGNQRREVGGLGGRPLPVAGGTQPYPRIFFGGGGGSGEQNNGQNHAGGAGGGIIFVITRALTDTGAGPRMMTANGAAGASNLLVATLDGMGGGGGGGTVVITTSMGTPIAPSLSVLANGGVGGSQPLNGNEAEGGGGGGGGGVILASDTLTTEQVVGGANGVTASTALTEFPPNGGTAGSAGTLGASPDRDGASSPFVCLTGPAFTNPVTNGSFKSSRSPDGTLALRFSAASEIAHAGYFIYGNRPGGERSRLGEFIPANATSADAPAVYQRSLIANDITELYIADVDLLGKETLRGPFTIGQEYGLEATPSPYDWSQSRAELLQSQTSLRGSSTSIAKVVVHDRGIQRVTHEQLLAAGVDLAGVEAETIAVIAQHGPVARRIRGQATFGAGSSIEFFGDVKPSLWSRDTFYLIRVDQTRALDMGLVTRQVTAAGVSQHTVELSYAPQNDYREASPTGDPWVADQLVAQGSPAQKVVQLSGPVPSATGAELKVVLWGGIDWPGTTPDHSVRIFYNNQQVASRIWDGITTAGFSVPVPVSSGTHTIRIELPGNTGHPADLIFVESIKLSYETSAVGNGSAFFGKSLVGSPADTIFGDAFGDAIGEPILGVVTVANVGGTDLRAYRISGPSATEYAVSGQVASLYAAGFSPESELWIGPAAQLISPAVLAAQDPDTLFGAPADWLVISHGAFMGSALTDLAALRQQQGLITRIVDVGSIFTRYSAGNPDPAAIQRYIAEARQSMGVDYVLLVGADTTDAPGYDGSGSVSFIPTPYETTSLFVRYTPADPLLADVDGDRKPDLAIGRLPVRTIAETNEAVRKILAYEVQPAANQAMLVAGPNDANSPIEFTAASESFSTGLDAAWSVDRVYQDEVGLSVARQSIVAGFNNGRSVISYIGHSGPNRWTFDPMLVTAQVYGTSTNPNLPNLAASVNQPIVLQFACWTTYFVSATQDTMAQALMLTPNRGASAVVGATVLLDMNSHQRMADAVRSRLVAGARIGDVIQAAKVAIAADPAQSTGPEILLGQILLGDPAQPIR